MGFFVYWVSQNVLASHVKPGIVPGMGLKPGTKIPGTRAEPENAMLTDTRCRTAKPTDKPYKLPDGKGLYLEVKPNGVKAWRYRFEMRVEGQIKEGMFAIGDYANPPTGESPEDAKSRRAGRNFTLAEAREERAKARALVKQGINPVHHRQLNRVKQDQECSATDCPAKGGLRHWQGLLVRHVVSRVL
jgi:hypothetical protein